jgi:hypothetical protein
MMPYKIEQRADKFVVVRENGGRVVGTHSSRAKATAQVRALYIHVKDAIEKAKFGSRSEAGKYAAHIRWMRERGMEPLTPDAWRSQNAQPVQPTRSSYESSLDAITSFATNEFQSRLRDAGGEINARSYDNGRPVSVKDYLFINEMTKVAVRDPRDPENTLAICSAPMMAVEREVNELGGLVHDAILEKMKQEGFLLPNGEFDDSKQKELIENSEKAQAVVDEIRIKGTELGLQLYTGRRGDSQYGEMKLAQREDPKDIDATELSPRLKNLHEKWQTIHQEFYEIPWSKRDANVSMREQLANAQDEYSQAAVAEFETWFNAKHNPSGGSHVSRLTELEKVVVDAATARYNEPTYIDRYRHTFAEVLKDLGVSGQSQIGTPDQLRISSGTASKVLKDKFVKQIHTYFPASVIQNFKDKYPQGLKLTKSNSGGHWSGLQAKIQSDLTLSTNLHEFMHAVTYADPRANFVERAFYMRRRTNGGRGNQPIQERVKNGWEKPKKTYDGGLGKRSDSDYIRDEFHSQYTGRYYADGYTETMTTGLDRIAGRGSSIEDQDHTNTVIGLLVAIGLGFK